MIAKVDAEAPNAKATAQDQGVTSYPTIKYFPKGSTEAVPYQGGRSEKDFVEFLNKHAGTHRAVGGGLDATGGTIAAMDAVVDKILAGKDGIADGLDELRKAATGDKDNKFAQYYLKVAEKAKDNAGYVEKELGRLQGLMSKGGLSREKSDDMMSRSNILRRFRLSSGKDEL